MKECDSIYLMETNLSFKTEAKEHKYDFKSVQLGLNLGKTDHEQHK